MALTPIAPTVSDTGIAAPSYAAILAWMQDRYRAIYGSDVNLDSDSTDGGWLAILAAAQADTNQAIISAYNQFSPATSQGAGLSSVVKINGLQRLIATNSTVDVLLVGQVGTIITNGIVGDDLSLGTQWALPASVTIPIAGEVTVTATCTEPGAVEADTNTLTRIVTPTAGWQSVTNPSAAATGAPVELDATLRQRQSVSTQLPSQTILGGIVGAIANLPGVTHYRAYENDTGTTDGNGLPGHSICLSVRGGDVQDIVDIIGARKTIGCATYGGPFPTTGTWVDPGSGIAYEINYNVPDPVSILVEIQLTPTAGYSTAIGEEIKTAVAAAINALSIGQDVQYTRLYAPALLTGPYASPTSAANSNTYELVAVLVSAAPDPVTAADVDIPFNGLAECALSDITITVV